MNRITTFTIDTNTVSNKFIQGDKKVLLENYKILRKMEKVKINVKLYFNSRLKVLL